MLHVVNMKRTKIFGTFEEHAMQIESLDKENIIIFDL